VRADRIYALVPIEAPERGDRRRTLVHVEGLSEPVVASRSERAIADDMATALGHDEAEARRRAGVAAEQEALF
jgi:hypothetical protein